MNAARFQLAADLFTEITVYAREAYPEEACGFLVGQENEQTSIFSITNILHARNLHPQREDRFLMDPLAYQRAEKFCGKHKEDNLRILGFWHSHPSSPPIPSSVDLEQAQGLQICFPQRYLYLILSLEQEEPIIKCWRLQVDALAFESIGWETCVPE